MRLNNLIHKPIVTEKTYAQATNSFYSFKVAMDANKESVAKEIEKMYGVKVIAVKTIVVPGKPRRVSGTRRYSGRVKWKTIDIMPKE
ncbi:MAG: 50S ribosomal protein L23 [candidate division WWE3 bacterium GW2011_GWF2_42_42]|uniref:50S ribosomal protein L23 n=1 Tax=candidate division WWE3 bacterium GW2011_GWF2_42_42 TaxID=1619142 RepID=A0A0G1AEN9_UNCKA|nr:MAG: 50S ribosomal protein L23 [candidate division WWE3 bacterium GW2011_GWF2_42_42]